MIIKKIEINNYRQYFGRHEVILGMDGKSNVNIFIGSTGAGKTNLSNALNWCFYGEEFSIEGNTTFPIMNKVVIASMDEGEVEYISVAVNIDYEGECYVIKREKNFVKVDDRCEAVPYAGSDDGSKFTVTFLPTKEKRNPSLNPEFPQTFINAIAPKKIREFFFFDGEKLKRYFQTDSKTEVRSAIFNISQLDLLEKIRTRLNKVVGDYRRDARAFTPDGGLLESELKKLGERIKELGDEIKDKEESTKKLDKEYRGLLDEYGALGGDKTKKLISDKKRIEEELDKETLKLEEVSAEKRKLLISFSYIIMGGGVIDRALDILKDAEENKKIPPNVGAEYIESLIKKGENCICNRAIGEKEKVALTKLAKSIMSMDDAIISMKIYQRLINLTSKEIPVLKKQLLGNNEKIEELNKSINEKKQLLKNIDGEMKSSNKDKLDAIYAAMERARESITSSSSTITLRKKEKEEKEILFSEKDKEYKKGLERDKRGRVMAMYITFTENAIKIAEEIQKKIMDEIRQEIASQTEEHYRELHWKKNEDINILISDDYSMSAIQGGDNKFGAFSAGEEALLAVSLIVALNNVSGFRVPIVMDTMLGRIDEAPSHNFAENIANYLKGTQIIFLFTQKEYSTDVKKSLDKYLYSRYKINLKDNNPLKVYFQAE